MGRAATGLELGPEAVVVPIELSDPTGGDRALEGTPVAGGSEPIVILAVEGIRGEGFPGIAIEVYLNLPSGQEPVPGSAYFVGDISLFGLQPQDAVPGHPQHSSTLNFDITPNIDVLRGRGEWQGEVEITFVARDLVGQVDTEATPAAAQGPWASIEAVTVSTG